MSQTALAEKSGIAQPSLSAIESGDTKNPQRPTLMAIGTALNDDLGEPWLRKYLDEQKKRNEAIEQVGAMFQSLVYLPDGEEKQEIWSELEELSSKVKRLVKAKSQEK